MQKERPVVDGDFQRAESGPQRLLWLACGKKIWADDEYLTDDQLSTAKQILLRNKIWQSEKPSSLTSQLSYQWCGTSFKYDLDYTENCMKVTKEDLKQFVKKIHTW